MEPVFLISARQIGLPSSTEIPTEKITALKLQLLRQDMQRMSESSEYT